MNQTVPTGTSVTTAAGGRATLDNGAQHIVVGPNSRLTVQPDAGGFTRIAQDLGAVMFKVDKKAAPHFRVDTPLLAAIVKGTTFTVMVEGASDAVSVAEGLVEVRSNLNSGVGSDVAAGATGSVLRATPGAVSVLSPASAPAGAAMPPVQIAPIDYKAVSGGLIDIAPAMANTASVQATRAAAGSGAVASNNAVGATVQDSPVAAPGGSVAAVASQIAGLEAGQRETPTQIATLTNNVLPGVGVAGNGNGAAGAVGGVVTTVSNTAGGAVDAAGGAVSGPIDTVGAVFAGSGNGNGSTGAGGVVGGAVTTVSNTTGGVVDTAGGAVTGLSDTVGAVFAGSGNGNGSTGVGGVVGGVVTTVSNTAGGVVNTAGGAVTGLTDNVGAVLGANGNSGSGSGGGSGSGSSSSNGGGAGGLIPTVIAKVIDTTGGLLGGLTGGGSGSSGSSGSGSSGTSGSGSSGSGSSGGLVGGLVGGLLGR